MTRFLIDSGALLAMIDSADRHHSAAATFVRSNATAIFYMPDTVFAETMVLTKARLGARPAIELGTRLNASVHFQIVLQTDEDRHTTWDIFSRYTDKDWSYVDCSVLALARRMRIAEIFAFDHHFDQMAELIRMPVVQ